MPEHLIWKVMVTLNGIPAFSEVKDNDSAELWCMISGKRWKIFSIAAIIWYSAAYELQDWEFFLTSLVGHSFLYIMQQDLCPTWSCDISFSLSRNIMENLKHYNAFCTGSHLCVAGWIHLPMWMELWLKTWDTVMCWVSFKFWIQFLFSSAAKWRMGFF